VARIRPRIHDLGRNSCRTLAEHDDPTGKEYCLFHVVGYQKRGEARALPQRHELFLHGEARQGIELAQRLIENEKLWIINKCPRQSRALRHSAGKLAWISRGETSKADLSQHVVDAFAMASKQPSRFQPEGNVAPNGAPWIKRWILKNDDA